MPREAKLFASSSGSVVRGYLKFRANITPRWIRNARTSRKRVEPEIVRSLRMLRDLKKNGPRARSAIEHAGKALPSGLESLGDCLQQGEFYRGIRILLELQRNSASNL